MWDPTLGASLMGVEGAQSSAMPSPPAASKPEPADASAPDPALVQRACACVGRLADPAQAAAALSELDAMPMAIIGLPAGSMMC